jgi:hypothetical protein
MEAVLAIAAITMLTGWALGGGILALIMKGMAELDAPLWARRTALVVLGTPLLAPYFLPSFLPAPVPLAFCLIWGTVVPSKFLAASVGITGLVLAVSSLRLGSNKQFQPTQNPPGVLRG